MVSSPTTKPTPPLRVFAFASGGTAGTYDLGMDSKVECIGGDVVDLLHQRIKSIE